jgi:hypothetical protein
VYPFLATLTGKRLSDDRLTFMNPIDSSARDSAGRILPCDKGFLKYTPVPPNPY